jgi:pimeloyl-ACP methyl ester carboxylesterase
MARTSTARAARLALVLAAGWLGWLGPLWQGRSAAAEPRPRGAFVNVGTAAAPMRLWVEEIGRGAPILLIHGLGANTYSWRYLAPGLARSHRVLSVDLKGFGRSDKPFDAAYGILDQARLLETLIAAKDLRGLTIVGHSLGGGVALALTVRLNLRRPATVDRLVLLDSIAYPQPVPLFIELLRTPVLAEVGIAAAPPELEAFKGLLAAYADPDKITWDAVRAYARPLYEEGGRHALLQTAQGIIPANLPALIAAYPTIQQPALLIWCAEDRVVPVGVGRRLARALPRAELSVFTGCGHVPQEEVPALTLARLRAFLEHHPASTQP